MDTYSLTNIGSKADWRAEDKTKQMLWNMYLKGHFYRIFCFQANTKCLLKIRMSIGPENYLSHTKKNRMHPATNKI